jgi:hypothetical protein
VTFGVVLHAKIHAQTESPRPFPTRGFDRLWKLIGGSPSGDQ